MTSQKLSTGEPFPDLNLNLIDGQESLISKSSGEFTWKLLIVYRGKHCPLCTRYLIELNNILDDLNELDVDVIAVSADSKEKAMAHLAEINPRYDVAYGLTVEQMQKLGLYISGPRNGMNVDAPFAEPGLFVINERNQLQLIDISNVPFARPSLQSILNGLRFLREMTRSFPINGSYAA